MVNSENRLSGQFDLNWPFAFEPPQTQADFRSCPEDFQVDEILGFEPAGEGEHVLLHLRKRGENTAWVARQIADLAGVNPMDVGYCGLKDRHAVTSQWFSVYLGKKPEADWQRLTTETTTLLAAGRHKQKLRRGMHAGNRFAITLRQVEGDRLEVERRLQVIATTGVPNYFGEQRFGRNGGNLELAQRALVEGEKIRDRNLRGLVMSAARSYLFNQVLAERVRQGNWSQTLDGDVVTGYPTGPLWGRGRPGVTDTTLMIEQQTLAGWRGWTDALEHVGLSQERRSLVLHPSALQWQWQGEALLLEFGLLPGAFATALLREVAHLRQLSGA